MTIKYASTALAGSNKIGKLTPDEDGYYELCLGALNIFNSSGIWYDYEASKHVFDNSSTFMRRMKSGNLYAEEDHPPFKPGMSYEEYVHRIKFIDTKNVCAHIKDVELIACEEVPGRMLILGKVKPDRERGQYLKAALDNPKQNVCFSLRSLVDERFVDGRKVRIITDLITFDWVIEPGLEVAHKYNAPGLESFDCMADIGDVSIPLSAIHNVINQSKQTGVGLESADIQDLEKIASRYIPKQKAVTKPRALKW